MTQPPHFEIAIVDSNTLAAMALQQLLQDIIPMASVQVFSSFASLSQSPQSYVHFFVASSIYFEHADFFRQYRSIVLVAGDLQVAGAYTLNVCQPQPALLRSLLALYQHHGGGSHMRPEAPSAQSLLSAREMEVVSMLVRGMINKEIADRLCVSLNTVITHRKNIMEKLHARSLADITIYAVMNGLVDIGQI